MTRQIGLGIRIDVDGKQIKGFVGATERDWKKVRHQLGLTEKQGQKTGRSFLDIHNRFVSYAASALSVSLAWREAIRTIDAGLDLDRTRLRFAAASDGALEAAREMHFFRAEAGRLKLDIQAYPPPMGGGLIEAHIPIFCLRLL